jgi:hypothetical protein
MSSLCEDSKRSAAGNRHRGREDVNLALAEGQIIFFAVPCVGERRSGPKTPNKYNVRIKHKKACGYY